MNTSHIKKLGKESLIYGLGGVISKFLGVFLLPILARILTPFDYGVIDYIATSFAIFTTFIIMGLDGALNFYYFDVHENQRKTFVNTVIGYELVIATIMTITLFFYAPRISHMLFKSDAYSLYIAMIAFTMPFELFISFGMRVCRLLFKPWYYNIIVFSRFILYALFSVLFIVVMKLSIFGYFLSQISGAILIAIIVVVMLKDMWRFEFNFHYLKKMLTYGVPLIPVSIAYWVINYSGRYFLKQYCTIEDIGYYAVALKIGMFVSLIISAIDLAWNPYSLSIKNEPFAKKIYASVFHVYVAFTLGVVLFIASLAKPAIYYLAAPRYLPAALIVGYLALMYVINAYYNFVSLGLNLVKKTYLISYTSILAAVISIILSYILVPMRGLEGAAWSLLVAYSISAVCTYLLSQKYYPIPYKIKNITILLALFSVIFVMIRLVEHSNAFIDAILKVSLTLLYVVVVVFKIIKIDRIRVFVAELAGKKQRH